MKIYLMYNSHYVFDMEVKQVVDTLIKSDDSKYNGLFECIDLWENKELSPLEEMILKQSSLEYVFSSEADWCFIFGVNDNNHIEQIALFTNFNHITHDITDKIRTEWLSHLKISVDTYIENQPTTGIK